MLLSRSIYYSYLARYYLKVARVVPTRIYIVGTSMVLSSDYLSYTAVLVLYRYYYTIYSILSTTGTVLQLYIHIQLYRTIYRSNCLQWIHTTIHVDLAIYRSSIPVVLLPTGS